MSASVIIVGAGVSRRMKTKINKPFIKVHNKPIILWTLSRFCGLDFVNEIILVLNKKDIKTVAKRYSKEFKKYNVSRIVAGGKRRQDSVLNGLRASNPKNDFVIIHDAARPLISREIINRAYKAALKCGCVIVARPSVDTIKLVKKGFVEKTLNRHSIWNAETPQIFRRSLLLSSIKKVNFRETYTDESQILEKAGIANVKVIPSDALNLKITTPFDLVLFRSILPLFRRE